MLDLQVINNYLNLLQKQHKGIIPYNTLITLVNKFGASLEELPLFVLNDKKFEVKPGMIVHFKSNADSSVMLKDIHFNNNNVEFSYKGIHYGHMQFLLGTNQVIFEENDIKLLDPNNNPIAIAGGDTFTEHHDL